MYSDYSTTSYNADVFAALGIFAIIALLIAIPIVVILIVGQYKVYKKAGKRGWEAIIPFYSTWVYVEIAGLNWWWFLITCASTIVTFIGGRSGLNGIASLASLFGMFVCNYNVAKKFNKDTTFAVLMTIFPVIMFPLMGFSKDYQFDDSVKVSNNGPFNTTSGNTNNTETSNNTTESETTKEENTESESKNVTEEDTVTDADTKAEEDSTDTTDTETLDNDDVIYCPNCGSKVSKDTKFCGNCGKEL